MELKNIDHWLIKENIEDIKKVDIDLANALKKRKILEGVRHFIDWDLFPGDFYNFYYDYEGSENEIADLIRRSNLSEYENVIICLGGGMPAFSINTNLFIEKWDDFASNGGYSGLLVFTKDLELIMEFSDDSEYFLYSNFPIKL